MFLVKTSRFNVKIVISLWVTICLERSFVLYKCLAVGLGLGGGLKWTDIDVREILISYRLRLFFNRLKYRSTNSTINLIKFLLCHILIDNLMQILRIF